MDYCRFGRADRGMGACGPFGRQDPALPDTGIVGRTLWFTLNVPGGGLSGGGHQGQHRAGDEEAVVGGLESGGAFR